MFWIYAFRNFRFQFASKTKKDDFWWKFAVSRVFKGFTIGRTTSVSFRGQQVIRLITFLKVKRTREFYFFKGKCGQDRQQNVKSDLYFIYAFKCRLIRLLWLLRFHSCKMHGSLGSTSKSLYITLSFSISDGDIDPVPKCGPEPKSALF